MIPCEESAVKKALTRDCFDRGIPRRQRENLSLSSVRLCRVFRLSPGQICLPAPLTLIREKFIVILFNRQTVLSLVINQFLILSQNIPFVKLNKTSPG